MLSDRDKYVSQVNKSQNIFDVAMEKDKVRIDLFSRHANVYKHLLDSAKHTDFTDFSFILNPFLVGALDYLVKEMDALYC